VSVNVTCLRRLPGALRKFLACADFSHVELDARG